MCGDSGNVLILNGTVDRGESLVRWLQQRDYFVETASTIEQAQTLLRRRRFDVILADAKLAVRAMEGLAKVRRNEPEISIILIADPVSEGSLREGFKPGASDILLEPVNPQSLLQALSRCVVYTRAQREITQLREFIQTILPLAERIGDSPASKRMHEFVELAAFSDAPVLIVGEEATGKEFLARAIHQRSPRRHRPFVRVSCAAPASSLESELFGSEEDAFAWPAPRKKGVFELAEGGTLFLDGIEQVAMSVQAKLLCAIQKKEIVRLGGGAPVAVDCRVIASTGERLEEQVRQGAFLAELRLQLARCCLEVPPLRERQADIPSWVHFFLRQLSADLNRSTTPELSSAALQLLTRYPWPGNLRELKNVLERALILSPGQMLDESALAHVFGPELALRPGCGQSLKELEKQHILTTLRQCGGNHSKTARLLGIDRSTLYAKLKRYAATG